ncbi:MAG: elongation factor P hydroxylase [Enterobacterales bacterium]|nr:elongation factor P hydroxylase [Enterobacterales bacterium]
MQLIEIFAHLFEQTENTQLQMGAEEPFYQAATDGRPAVIYFREDFFSSALHEIAHWTIAGLERRQQDDFGYWYEADGRTKAQQIEFERVEVKPQAIEWLLSLASNQTFHFSADNLAQNNKASDSFKQAVFNQADYYFTKGLPPHAQQLYEQLNAHFRAGKRQESPCLELV